MEKNEMELLPCPFCGWNESETIFYNGWTVRQCLNCGGQGPYGSTDWNARALPPAVVELQRIGKAILNDATNYRDNSRGAALVELSKIEIFREVLAKLDAKGEG